MPTVPSYGVLQVRQQANPNQRFEVPAAQDVGGQQAQMIGQGIQRVGQTVSAIEADMQFRANAARHDESTNELVAEATRLRAESMALKGKNALDRPDGKSLPDEYSEKLDKVRNDIASKLSNDAQRMAFANTSGRILTQFRGALSDHTVKQQEVYEDDTARGSIETATNQGSLFYGDPVARQQSYDVIRGAVDSMAARKGWDEKVREAEFSKAVTPMHAAIMNTMIKGGRAMDAKAYYDANSAEMTVQARANMQNALTEAVASQKSEGAVSAVWSEIGPQSMNDPVKLFDLEAKLRENLKDDPDTYKRAVQDLRQRTQAFNAQQSEMKAGNTASVWQMIDSGASFAEVQRSDVWLSMSGTERHNIRKALDAEAYTQESRAAARASRAASEASRQLSQMQVAEKVSFLRNGDRYLSATDPDVLRSMSRTHVEALRTDFGMDATKQLLEKWDNMQKPGKLAEARIDKQDFDELADRFGLDPFAPSKTEDQRKALGTLQFQIEQMISAAEKQSGKPLDRQARFALVEQEMAKTVLVDPGFFSREKKVPVLGMTKEQAERVVIPDADRERLIENLRAVGLPVTESNVRKYYLQSISKAGAYIR